MIIILHMRESLIKYNVKDRNLVNNLKQSKSKKPNKNKKIYGKL